MTKAEQQAINDKVMAMLDKYTNGNESVIRSRRLRTCSAVVLETSNYYVLQSYATIIALIDKETDICYDFLRYVYGYTSTSGQHIAKFRHDYEAVQSLTYRR